MPYHALSIMDDSSIVPCVSHWLGMTTQCIQVTTHHPSTLNNVYSITIEQYDNRTRGPKNQMNIMWRVSFDTMTMWYHNCMPWNVRAWTSSLPFDTIPCHHLTWHDTSKHTSTQWIDQSLVHRPRDSRFIQANRQYMLVIDIDIDIHDKGGNVTSQWNTNRHGKVGAVKNASYKMNETLSSRYYVTR